MEIPPPRKMGTVFGRTTEETLAATSAQSLKTTPSDGSSRCEVRHRICRCTVPPFSSSQEIPQVEIHRNDEREYEGYDEQEKIREADQNEVAVHDRRKQGDEKNIYFIIKIDPTVKTCNNPSGTTRRTVIAVKPPRET